MKLKVNFNEVNSIIPIRFVQTKCTFNADFGDRFIDDVSVAEVNDYLSNLYYEKEYAYKYVESFLKVFYLIFGQAYSRNYLDVDAYNKLCKNKDTKIHMPN